MSNIYFCSKCSQAQSAWIRMNYVKWVTPWTDEHGQSAGDLYECPLCGHGIVEYARLDPKPNRQPQDAIQEGHEFTLLQGLLNG